MVREMHSGRLFLFAWAILMSFAACTGTGLAPIGQDGFQPEEDEKRIWSEARDLQLRFDRSGLVSDDTVVTAYLNRVAFKLIPENARESVVFQIRVLKHPIPNAFALPHGALYVHTGMLARKENEAQLAAVIAHEVVHIIRRHTLLTFRNVKQAAGFTSTLGVIGAPAGLYGLGVVLLGTVGALAAVSGYSQSLEDEADREGMRLMVNARYDPGEALKMIENVERYVEQDEIKQPFFFSTHPRLQERRASYQRLLDAEYRSQTGFKGQEEFTAILAPTILDNAFLELARSRFAFAQETAEKSLALNANNPKAHFLLAEIFRQRGATEDQEQAEKEYQKTIDLEPSFADAHRGLGLLDYKKGQLNLAREHFEKYLAFNPTAKDRAFIEQYLKESRTGED
jgi:beta-barrel assembly-enhancing protease